MKMVFPPRILRRRGCEMITLILMFTAVSAILPVSTASDLGSEGCDSGQLLKVNETSPHMSVSLTKGISVQIAAEGEEELLHLQLVLEDQYGVPTYIFGIEANKSMALDIVTLFDVHSGKLLLQVPWPRVLIAQRWTTLTLHLATEQLLQIVVPHEEQDAHHPKHKLWLGVSVGLFDHHRISRMSLRLVDGSSLKYVIKCGMDFIEASSESKSESTCTLYGWRTWSYILLSIVALQLIIILTMTVKYVIKMNWTTFKTYFQQNSDNADDRKEPRVSFSKNKTNQEKSAKKPVAGLEAPNVIVGVVSSRAPSPGLEMDEQTTDYINKAYMSD